MNSWSFCCFCFPSLLLSSYYCFSILSCLFVCVCILAEDVDPTIGRFRNMIQSSLVPVKRPRLDSDPPLPPIPSSPTSPNKFTQPLRSVSSSSTQLYSDLPLSSPTTPTGSLSFTSSFLSRTITAGLWLIFDTVVFSVILWFCILSAPPVENPVNLLAVGGASVPPAVWTVESQVTRV